MLLLNGEEISQPDKSATVCMKESWTGKNEARELTPAGYFAVYKHRWT
jgi:hypothetical protein